MALKVQDVLQEGVSVWYSTRVYTHLSPTVFMTDRASSLTLPSRRRRRRLGAHKSAHAPTSSLSRTHMHTY